MGWRARLLLIGGMGCSVVFMATTVIMLIGMMPTIAARAVDRSYDKSRSLSVGLMNFAGCMPFLLELWMGHTPNDLGAAMQIILQPKTIIIIYVIAAAGYAIEIAVTGMVSSVMQQRAKARFKAIDKELAALRNRYDEFVDGSVALDDYGFPYGKDDE